MPVYLDENGNPIPAGGASATAKVYLDPNTGEPLPPKADFSSLTANPKGEGTYKITTHDGQTLSVPYSNVPVFTQNLQGANFASPDEEARFNKDAAADPHRPTFGQFIRGNDSGEQAIDRASQLEPMDYSSVGGFAKTALENLGAGATQATLGAINHPLMTLGGIAEMYGAAMGGPGNPAQQDLAQKMVTPFVENPGGAAFAAVPQAALAWAGGPVAEEATSSLFEKGKAAFDAAREKARGVIAGDVNAPMPGTDVTPAERYQAMQRVGVQPNAAEATNSVPLKAVEKINQNSLMAAPVYQKVQAANVKALNRFTNELLDNMSPSSPEDGGAAVQQALVRSHADLKQAATEAYQDLDEQAGTQPVSGTAGLRQQAQAILDNNRDYYAAHPEFEPTKAMAIVRDVAGAKRAAPTPAVVTGFGPAAATPEVTPPPDMTYGELHRLRSDLLDFNNTNPDLVKNQANGWISQLAGAADKAITSSEGGLAPDQVETFRNANEAWKMLKDTYDNPSHPFYNAVRTPSPSTLVNGAAGISRTPEMVRQLSAVLSPEDMGPIQRGVAEKLLGVAQDGSYDFRNFQARLNKLPEQYRSALFAPDHLQRFNDLASRAASSPFLDPQSPLFKVAQAPDPTMAMRNIAQTPQTVRMLQGVLGPRGMGPIQRSVAEDLLGTTKEGNHNFKTFQGQWNKLPEDYRNTLFNPEQLGKLNDIGNVGTVLHADLNPSGTAKLGQGQAEMFEGGGAAGAALMGHPAALIGTGGWHALQFALAKAMNSPRFVDWLMKDQGAAPVVPAALDGTGPLGQPNYYSEAMARARAAFNSSRQQESGQ